MVEGTALQAVLRQVMVRAKSSGEEGAIRLQGLPEHVLEVHWFGWTTESAWRVPWEPASEDGAMGSAILVQASRLVAALQALDGDQVRLTTEGEPASVLRLRGKKRRASVPIEVHQAIPSTGFRLPEVEGLSITIPATYWRDLATSLFWAVRDEAMGGPPALQHIFLHRNPHGQWEWVAADGQWVVWRTWDIPVPDAFTSVVCPISFLKGLAALGEDVTWVHGSTIGSVRTATFESRARWVDAPYPKVNQFREMEVAPLGTWDAEAWVDTLRGIFPMARFGESATVQLAVHDGSSTWVAGDQTTQVEAEIPMDHQMDLETMVFPIQPLQALTKMAAGSPTLHLGTSQLMERPVYWWQSPDPGWAVMGIPHAR